ncbi:UNVERIFIED_CONTAM: hypothetical protein Sindi_2460900 [Sesamum indicum]
MLKSKRPFVLHAYRVLPRVWLICLPRALRCRVSNIVKAHSSRIASFLTRSRLLLFDLAYSSSGTMSSPSNSRSSSSTDASPHSVVPPSLPEGPSRARSRRRSHRNDTEELDSKETPTYARFQSMLDNSPWAGIVSSVKQPIHKIKEKYFIPHNYEVVIPKSFDRMHRPPKGFCAFSLHHFDVGLRLPLAPSVAHILNKLKLFPMQLSPNSICQIVLFIIVMRVHRFEPNFDNFWSLYSFTTSKRSADRGFFHLSARKDCRFLDPLTSNVGPWKRKFVFIRPPPEKPTPVLEGGGLERYQINSLTSFRYDPKRLLVEEILRLAHLTPAPLWVEESLVNVVDQARLTQRIRAALARTAARANPPPNPTPSATSIRPEPDQSPVPTSNVPQGRALIEAGESNPCDLVHRKRRSMTSPLRPTQASRDEEIQNMERFGEVTECWKKAREDLHSPHHQSAELHGETLVPDWKISSTSTVLNTLSRQDSWEFYNAICPPKDQATLLQTSFTRLEEHAAHSLVQAANFMHVLSLKCAGFRRNQLMAEHRNLEARLACLEAKNKELEEKMNLEIAQAMQMGKESGFSAGHAVGKIAGAIEGREEFLRSEDFGVCIREARLQGARDFMKVPAFESALEIKAADYLMQGFERCKAQVTTLSGFVPNFDITKLDPGLSGDLQPFPVNANPPPEEEDEFAVLLDEIED